MRNTLRLLTGLPNRALFSDRLGQALSTARREHAHAALIFLDLDHFKPVNDTWGHAVGDVLLRTVEDEASAICHPFDVNGHRLDVSTSIGLALYPQHGSNEVALSKNADDTMYPAKRKRLDHADVPAGMSMQTCLRNESAHTLPNRAASRATVPGDFLAEPIRTTGRPLP